MRAWSAPSPVFPRGRWRLWLTLAIAVLQVVAVTWFIVYVAQGRGGLPSE